MKYTKELRLDIGFQIYSGEITYGQAMEKYDIGMSSLKEYVRLYREVNGLPGMKKDSQNVQLAAIKCTEPNTLEEYEAMSKEELISELVKARIAEARLKKGYEVKGDGTVIRYDKKNIK